MTVGHAAVLHFDDKYEAAKKRLQKLKTAGIVGERRRQVNEPSVLFLARKGLIVLREHGLLAQYPPLDLPVLDKRSRVSELTLRHELAIMDVKAAFHTAIKTAAVFTIAEFSTWPLLYQFEAFRPGYSGAEVTVKPDGFVRIHEKEKDSGLSEHTFFLEVDRSSETQDTLVARAGCYVNYYKSGGFAVRNGADRSAYKEYPFRVLMVFKSAERRNNTAERLLQSTPPILTQVCLSTFDEVTADLLGPVWTSPRDYREATTGTPFDTERRTSTFGYRSQPEREIFIERNVRKWRILSDEQAVQSHAHFSAKQFSMNATNFPS
jgi:hypothetical protein